MPSFLWVVVITVGDDMAWKSCAEAELSTLKGQLMLQWVHVKRMVEIGEFERRARMRSWNIIYGGLCGYLFPLSPGWTVRRHAEHVSIGLRALVVGSPTSVFCINSPSIYATDCVNTHRTLKPRIPVPSLHLGCHPVWSTHWTASKTPWSKHWVILIVWYVDKSCSWCWFDVAVSLNQFIHQLADISS